MKSTHREGGGKSIPLRILAAGLALLCAPSLTALANSPPAIDSFNSSAPWIAPGGVLTFSVSAHDPDCSGTCTTGCGLYIRSDLTAWSSSGGTFTATNNGTSGSPYAANATWQAPSTPGTYSVSVTIWDSGGFTCGGKLSATATLPIAVSSSPPNQPPTITSLTWDHNPIFPAQAATVTVSATDPEGDSVAYAWSVDIGTIVPAGPTTALYTAPAYPAKATITCVAADSMGASSSATTVLSVTSATADHVVTGPLRAPTHVAILSNGDLAVADSSPGQIVILAGGGTPADVLSLSAITSVAADWADHLLVGTVTGAAVLDRQGIAVLNLTPPSPLGEVADVAVDRGGRRYVVLYGSAGRVVAYDSSGLVTLVFGSNGAGVDQFQSACAVAVSPTGQILVGDRGGLIHLFDGAGLQVTVFGGAGGAAGQFIQLSGLAVDARGLVYASDAFQSRVQVFSLDGAFREFVGGYGADLGHFMTPAGIAVDDPTGQMLVASINGPNIQVFKTTSAAAAQPPTTPTLMSPADGSQFAQGAAIVLAASGSTDPQNKPLQYQFELDLISGGTATLVQTWLVPEALPGPTHVDATAAAAVGGSYAWKSRAYDGTLYSAWAAAAQFTVTQPPPNHPPSAPGLLDPTGGIEIPVLTPDLVVTNATDPDGDHLTYLFEVSVMLSGGYAVVAVSPAVPGDASGRTAWSIPPEVLSKSQAFIWRCAAFDGKAYGAWSPFGAAWTPPFAIPTPDAVGNLPDGDRTRAFEVHYAFPARSADVTLYFQLYDVTTDTEASVEVNGAYNHTVPAQLAGAWSHSVSFTIPAAELNPGAPNRIRFLHPGTATDPWGIRDVSFELPHDIPRIGARAYNTVVDVSWTAEPLAPPGSKLRLYRSDGPGWPFFLIGDFPVPDGLHRDANLVNGTAYAYKACYVDPSGIEGVFSTVVTATPVPAGGVTPITDLRVTASGRDLLLTWSSLTSDPPLQAIEIYSDQFGTYTIDTATFSNQIAVVDGASVQVLVPGGADPGLDGWYLAVPLDTSGARGRP